MLYKLEQKSDEKGNYRQKIASFDTYILQQIAHKLAELPLTDREKRQKKPGSNSQPF